jgi:hypothetical protein
MADRSAVIVEKKGCRDSLTDFLRFLERSGLSLEHPRQGVVFLLDQDGEQVAASQEQLLELVQDGMTASFQLWFAWNHDVYCRVRCANQDRVIDLGLEGSTESERRRVLKALASYFRARVRDGTVLGLVFDPEGGAAGVDWVAFFQGHYSLSPDALAAGTPVSVWAVEPLPALLGDLRFRPVGDGIFELGHKGGLVEESVNGPTRTDFLPGLTMATSIQVVEDRHRFLKDIDLLAFLELALEALRRDPGRFSALWWAVHEWEDCRATYGPGLIDLQLGRAARDPEARHQILELFSKLDADLEHRTGPIETPPLAAGTDFEVRFKARESSELRGILASLRELVSPSDPETEEVAR